MANKTKPPSPKKQQKVDAIMQKAVVAHQAGDLLAAERGYRKALKEVPGFAEALHLLGLARFQNRDAEGGEQYIQKAIVRDGSNALFYFNLANVQKSQGKLEAAAKAYRRALELNPGYYQAAANLGGVYKDLGLLEEAIEQLNVALRIHPGDAIACNNLGTVHRQRNNNEQAEHFFRQAIQLQPNYAEALSNMGILLRDKGNHAEAEQLCRQAVKLSPDISELWVNLGSVLARTWRLNDAIDSYRHALELAPNNAITLAAYGNALREQGNVEEAIAMLLQSNTGEQFNSIYWDCLLYTLNYSNHVSRAAALEHAVSYGDSLATCLSKQEITSTSFSTSTSSASVEDKVRLKVGFVSPDFRVHSCAYFLLPLLQNLNRDQFEVYCYSTVENPDAITARFQDLTDHWCDALGMDDWALASAIKQDTIYILVDLAGHTRGNRLPVFAIKPAPVQATWLGYPNTTGLKTMDYRLTDSVADPDDSDDYYTEKLVRLSHGFLCFEPLTQMPEVSPLPALTNGYITFGCMNNFSKVTDEVLDLWQRLLKQIPGSRLLLKAKQLADEGVKDRVINFFQDHEIESSRLSLHGQMPSRDDHFAQYHHIDIALDPFPYNGTTTTCEALWMGVPVVCLNGDRHAGRVGASLMTHAGLPQLIATDKDHYLSICKDLSGDFERLAQLRKCLRATLQGSDLCNSKQFTHDIEAVFHDMRQALLTH